MKLKSKIVECTFDEMKKRYPHIYKFICSQYPSDVLEDFETDPEYIVRIDLLRSICEIGYLSDKWVIS